jgi:Ribosomal RNA adenine dimethylase
MNLAHRWLCRSAYWRKAVETYILHWVLDGLDIGANVLEVGPGPGVTTDLLRGRVEHLTCVEIDRAFADSLARRMSGHNVTVVRQDATAMLCWLWKTQWLFTLSLIYPGVFGVLLLFVYPTLDNTC